MNQPTDTIHAESTSTLPAAIEKRGNPESGQHSIHASKHFYAGEIICPFSAADAQSFPTRHTLQTGAHTHIILFPAILQYTNHSCAPTAFFDTTAMQLICIKDMMPGDEITFFYPSTEWEMSDPFICGCGADNCLGTILGASGLPTEILFGYKLTGFITSMLSSRVSARM